ncbi:MAG: peptide MFS transporter [Phycisphaerales bacterium]|nr:MAG: peptide MFS transporter [Phycisphaerales bacterium]
MADRTENPPTDPSQLPTLFGHPTGLYTLFFAEMWERFSFYGMRALLIYYMIKGFLQYQDPTAYSIYGAYGGLVYMMPFFGGMIADRLIGARRAVVLGGVLMALGHLLMGVENQYAFFCALGLLICGNGFFKPNISTIVGTLYPKGSVKRDGGFTIFYMGINLGAAMAPLVCGYIGETYGWHYGFGLATIGMVIGLAVFVAPVRLTQVLILSGALVIGIGMYFLSSNPYLLGINALIGTALIVSGCAAVLALSRGGLPHWAGAPAVPARLKYAWMVYLGVVVAVPVLAWLVYANARYNLVSEDFINRLRASEGDLQNIAATFLNEISTPAGLILMTTLFGAFVFLFITAVRSTRIVRHRMYVVLILTFFSLLFWAFFEQAGSSINNFTDRNIDRVRESRVVEAADVGSTIDIVLTQEQLGYANGDQLYTLDVLTRARDAQREAADVAGEGEEVSLDVVIPWTVSEDDIGMGIADSGSEIPGSIFQSVNPSYILLLGLVFTALWAFLARFRLEPSTPVKFAFGLIQLGLGFVALWYGAQNANERGMVFVGWLLLGYLLHTTGELCLSPVGLSMVTKLSPRRLVSTVMGAWFLATAASSFVAAIIAQFTGVGHGGNGEQTIPVPAETVHVYGDVFKIVAYLAVGCGVVCLLLAPLLKYWMHIGQDAED